jgi:hypothetical protein
MVRGFDVLRHNGIGTQAMKVNVPSDRPGGRFIPSGKGLASEAYRVRLESRLQSTVDCDEKPVPMLPLTEARERV